MFKIWWKTKKDCIAFSVFELIILFPCIMLYISQWYENGTHGNVTYIGAFVCIVFEIIILLGTGYNNKTEQIQPNQERRDTTSDEYTRQIYANYRYRNRADYFEYRQLEDGTVLGNAGSLWYILDKHGNAISEGYHAICTASPDSAYKWFAKVGSRVYALYLAIYRNKIEVNIIDERTLGFTLREKLSDFRYFAPRISNPFTNSLKTKDAEPKPEPRPIRIINCD